MRSLVWMVVIIFSAAAWTASAQEPTQRLLRPNVLPSEHELANPHLYYPRVSERYMAPPDLYGPPPPADSVRPGEFESLDATIISVSGASGSYGTMWVEMVDTYASSGGHTWIIISDGEKAGFEGMLTAAGVSSGSYSFLNYPFNSIWVRDYGPEFVRDTTGVRYIFDADYSWRPMDDQVPVVIGAGDWINSDGSPMEVNTVEHGLAGGNVMSDGAGTCFFSKIVYGYEKPASWSDEQVDDLMEEYLGCEQIITLNSICLDPTGHIDLYAKLMTPTSILLAEYPVDTHFDGTVSSGVSSGHCSTPGTPNDYQDQEDNLAIIQATTAVDGTPWTVTRLRLPEPYNAGGNDWVYRSYMNSEIMNNWVAMPSFYTPHGSETAADLLDLEADAIAAYETARPGVNVVAIDVDHMDGTGGAIHCISHDVPEEAGGAWTPPTEYCGDGVVNGDEECDGEDVGDIACSDFGQGLGSYVKCSPDCTYDTSQCAGPECGNGVVDEGEECDPCILSDEACDSVDLGSGFVECNADCTKNYLACSDGTPCKAAALTEPGMVCCPEPAPGDCSAGSWSWSSQDSYYGCCTQDLEEVIWCEGSDYVNNNCLSSGGACGYISSGPYTDCSDNDLPETYDTTLQDECDELVDPNEGDDAGTDAGADGGKSSSGDDGCGCATTGSSSVSSSLLSILSNLF